MKIKQILLLLVAAATLVFATACGDPKDGNTSGSAESNGMISDQTDDRGESLGNGTNSTSEGMSDGLGSDVSDVISDAGDVISDVVSDAENGVSDAVSDLFGDDGSDTQG